MVIYSFGIRITVITSPFGAPIMLGWAGLPVTVLWIVIVTNAVNRIDGLDGLAAGTGSLAGFLFYNFAPASIFMGDSGSLFIGLCLGAISILSSHKTTAMTTIMIPIIAFGFPLMDMFYAVLRRYYRVMSSAMQTGNISTICSLKRAFRKRRSSSSFISLPSTR
ncbi:MAG: MraY family glycosyltransferase [Thermodesulfovibrionales bacterium]